MHNITKKIMKYLEKLNAVFSEWLKIGPVVKQCDY